MSLLVLFCLVLTNQLLYAQETSGTADENITNINWDEEEEDSKATSEDLSEINWDEGMDEDTSKEEMLSAADNSAERKAIEEREFVIHVWGFLLFAFYLMGLVFTAYFTRNRKISVHYAPELLIILHIFWPVEWICLLFAGQKVK